MSSAFCDYLDEVKPRKVGADYVVKVLGARKAVMALPDPGGTERAERGIPDIPVEVVLSTSDKVAEVIARLFDRSVHRSFFLENPKFEFDGLCINGRGMPVKLFIHEGHSL